MSLPNLFISTGRHDQSVVELLNTLFQDGAGAGVSDVHIEEEATGGVIRLFYLLTGYVVLTSSPP